MPWALPSGRDALLALATDYPYPAPAESYLFAGGEARLLPPAAWAALDLAGRVPVLAHGSNRSPEQLRRKFGDRATIPVAYGWLSGYDVVYAAHVARYGAITSTLAALAGVRARVAVTWLSLAQLAFMHETERMNYAFGRLPAGVFTPEAGPPADPLALYLGNHGPLYLEGSAVALAAVTAEGRSLPALDQAALQARLGALYHPGKTLEELLLARIADPALRRAFELQLRAERQPENLPGFTLVQRLDETLA